MRTNILQLAALAFGIWVSVIVLTRYEKTVMRVLMFIFRPKKP